MWSLLYGVRIVSKFTNKCHAIHKCISCFTYKCHMIHKCISWFTYKCHATHKCKTLVHIYLQTNKRAFTNRSPFVNIPAFICGFFYHGLIHKYIYFQKDMLCIPSGVSRVGKIQYITECNHIVLHLLSLQVWYVMSSYSWIAFICIYQIKQ